MSKDVDRAFLSSITYGLGGLGDIDCICAVISVFLLRRGYYCEINVISRENDSGHATIEIPLEYAITVWHCRGCYAVCRGISAKSWPRTGKAETHAAEFTPSSGYIELFDFLDREFPGEKNEGEDYFSELFSKGEALEISKGEALEIRKVEALENIAACLKPLVPAKD